MNMVYVLIISIGISVFGFLQLTTAVILVAITAV